MMLHTLLSIALHSSEAGNHSHNYLQEFFYTCEDFQEKTFPIFHLIHSTTIQEQSHCGRERSWKQMKIVNL